MTNGLWDLSSPTKSRDWAPWVGILTPGHKIAREILTPGSINQWELPQTSPSKYKTQHNLTACSTQPCMSNPNNKKTGTKGNHHQRVCLQKTQNTLPHKALPIRGKIFSSLFRTKAHIPPNMKPTKPTGPTSPKSGRRFRKYYEPIAWVKEASNTVLGEKSEKTKK